MKISEFKKIKLYDHAHDLQTHLKIDSLLEKDHHLDELTIRFWVSKGVVFGKLDTLLDNFQKGEDYINQCGYPTTIRKSGGLAVVLDKETINLSFIFRKQNKLLESYEIVSQWLIDFFMMNNIDIKVQEVPNSYCPGKYDLVHNHQKICGIAQIRTKSNVIIQLNIMLEGDQKARTQLIKTFYEISNSKNNPTYPQIDICSMKSLDLLTIDQFKQKFIQYLISQNNNIQHLDKK